MKIIVPLEISQERIEDLLCCAFEGGIGYWAQVREEGGTGTYLHEKALSDAGFVTLEDSTGEGWPSQVAAHLTRETIIVGLQVMAAKYPKHFADFMEENEDAETGDVLAQCALFGEVVFG